MSRIQAVIFNKKYYSKRYARKWLRIHNLIPIKNVHETKRYYRYRIRPPEVFSRFATKSIEDGTIKLVLGFY